MMNASSLASAVLVVCCLAVLPVRAADGIPTPELVRFNDGGKVGFKNRAGEVVVPATYDDAGRFAFGRAPVNLGAAWAAPGAKSGGKWGYVGEHGKLVVPITLDYAQEFSEGLARVSKDGKTRYIDPSGKTVITLPPGITSSGDFSEGLAPVRKSSDAEDVTTEYIDKQGGTLFRIAGWGHEFHEGLAAVSVRNRRVAAGRYMSRLCGFIDKMGQWVVEPTYAEVKQFSEGLAAVRPTQTTVYGKGDSWGYINKQGKLVIPLRFNEAQAFSGGVAVVHAGGELVQIDLHVPPFWKGGEWLIIDKEGKVLKRSSSWIDAPEFRFKTAGREGK